MVVGVRGGCSGFRGGLAGWPAGVLLVQVDVLVALGGLGWAGRCRVAPWLRGRLWGATDACGGVVLWWGLQAFRVLRWYVRGLQNGDGGRL